MLVINIWKLNLKFIILNNVLFEFKVYYIKN